VSPRSDFDANLIQLSDRLRRVRQVLISKTVVAPEPEALIMADFGSGSGYGGVQESGSRYVPGRFDSEPDSVYNPHSYPRIPQRFDDSTLDMENGSGSGHSIDTGNDWEDDRFPQHNNNNNNNNNNNHQGSNNNGGSVDTSSTPDKNPERGGCIRLSSSGRMSMGVVLLSWLLLSNVIN